MGVLGAAGSDLGGEAGGEVGCEGVEVVEDLHDASLLVNGRNGNHYFGQFFRLYLDHFCPSCFFPLLIIEKRSSQIVGDIFRIHFGL